MSVRNLVAASAGVPSGPVQGQYFIGGLDGSNVVWTVPAGVTSICVLAIQEGQGGGPSGTQEPCDVLRFDLVTRIVRAQNGNRIGTGGGDGGAGGAYFSTSYAAGGGGAGGYSGNGGAGASNFNNTAGSGGGGGGGNCKQGSTGSLLYGGGGGGVGVFGQGSNGNAPGTSGAGGGGGSGGNTGTVDGASEPNGSAGALYGGGGPGSTWSTHSIANKGGSGGALAYANNVSVTPGENLLLRCYGAAAAPGTAAGCNNAAIRIIWGPGRSFPSTNTGDV